MSSNSCQLCLDVGAAASADSSPRSRRPPLYMLMCHRRSLGQARFASSITTARSSLGWGWNCPIVWSSWLWQDGGERARCSVLVKQTQTFVLMFKLFVGEIYFCIVIYNRCRSIFCSLHTISLILFNTHTRTYTRRHTHKHSFHGNRIQGLLWLVVCPGQLKMVSAVVHRQKIYVWILSYRTGATIDY